MAFLDDKYLLGSESALGIFSKIQNLPIVDPHNHADVAEIARNTKYSDPWQVFAATDHYVWEVMRKREVPENLITGSATPKEKWMALAKVMPEIAGNPVFEWIHLDLRRRFGIETILTEATAEDMWEEVKAALAVPSKYPLPLLKEMNVEVMCSTDDPIDTLEHHGEVNDAAKRTLIRPTWRPDKSKRIQKKDWKEYIRKLSDRFQIKIDSVGKLVEAMKLSHKYFEEHGCRASDHDTPFVCPCTATEADADAIFQKAVAGKDISNAEFAVYADYLTARYAEMDAEAGWVYQMHIGVRRDVRDIITNTLGPDAGGDVSDHWVDIVLPLCSFLNHTDEKLKVVLYTLEPSHTSSLATVARAFGSKVRLGSAWWLNDTPIGMKRQLEYIGSVDVWYDFAGMVSDSRKILSYASRFEMFRRVLADVLGDAVEMGKLPYIFAENLAVKMAYEEPKKFFNL